jgi:7-keto-8-aminopelargonate synthetase-like enzyme
MAELLRSRLHERGVDTAGSASQIMSIFFNERDACHFYGALRDKQILTSVFVYPAVPSGISLVRFSVYSELTASDIHYIADCIVETIKQMRS